MCWSEWVLASERWLRTVEEGEPSGVIEIKGEHLTGTVIEGSEVPNVIDEIPVLAVAGALAQGRTIIRDAKELRSKETDRIAAIAANLGRWVWKCTRLRMA